jgi:hypothetical protein
MPKKYEHKIISEAVKDDKPTLPIQEELLKIYENEKAKIEEKIKTIDKIVNAIKYKTLLNEENKQIIFLERKKLHAKYFAKIPPKNLEETEKQKETREKKLNQMRDKLKEFDAYFGVEPHMISAKDFLYQI